ncbi:nuclear receptor 2C2-associated protein-like isoform X2 [Stegodyphus dumicola]|uniref:nuclear receptor 2C2-associated protein-like isoform X2 n=1 Tax=Stegodyphus dumicola TaxID=202533 RepID=UPI0015AD03CD|nr:nuclear receptor 2C2-associated protein-like isoform X2 [Stegodyphus dumicola]
MSISLINKDTVVRVSSVLNKYSKQYGKQYITDKCDDTCWNSDQGSPQWIQLDFPRLVSLEELHIQFQGGFAGKESWIEIRDGDDMGKVQSIYPEDNNSLQIFSLPKKCTNCLRVVFNSSTDFFGRVIVYKLDIIGNYI